MGQGVGRPHGSRRLSAPKFARIEENGRFFLSPPQGERQPRTDRFPPGPHGPCHRTRAEALVRGRSSPPSRATRRRGGIVAPERGSRGRHRGDTLRARLGAVGDAGHQMYPICVTPIPVDVRPGEEMAEPYRTRCSVEPLFNEAKGLSHLGRWRRGTGRSRNR